MILFFLGWGGTALLLLSSWQLGSKQRIGFVTMIVGEVAWIMKGVWLVQLDLVVMCAVFTVLGIRNYINWGRATA